MSDDNETWVRNPAASPSPPAAALRIAPGTVLKSTYRIEQELGSGGMGTVFLATHLGLEKRMAVKVLSPRAVASPESLARFEREAKVAGKVSHPAMTHVIDFGLEQGTPYIVMEYVDGVELAQLIDRNGALPPRQAVAVMRQLISLLRAAHALGIVHRDLKPANIKVIEESPDTGQLFVKVLDFGIAKVLGDLAGALTSEGMMVGTPAYMAPEQIAGKPIDGRTDLYSAGLIFHEMLSGSRAYQGETIARILHAQMTELPPPITRPLPEVVHQTLRRFHEKRSEDRFQDAAEADRALLACEEALRNFAPDASSPQRPDTGRFPSVEGLSATMQRPEALAPSTPPQPAAPVSPPSNTGQRPAPAIATDRQPAPVIPAPPMGPRVPPAPTHIQPKRAAGSKNGLLWTVLVIGGMGLSTCLTGLIWAWRSGGIEKAIAQAEASEDALDHQNDGDAPHPNHAPPMPAGLMPTPVCYAIVMELESTREENGQYGPWEIAEERSRAPVPCNTVRTKEPSAAEQELLADWPPEAKVLRMEPLSSIPPTADDPFTRRKLVLIHALVENEP
ncbi:MAG TPA: protein kinase [Myxococcaceae bacterium]|jgi:serine/threonine protein kinase